MVSSEMRIHNRMDTRHGRGKRRSNRGFLGACSCKMKVSATVVAIVV
jgi:hypothetical protein